MCSVPISSCAFEGQYNIVLGADQFLPVDIFIPGCPPRPEALLQGIIQLEELVSGWKRFKDPEKARLNRKMNTAALPREETVEEKQ